MKTINGVPQFVADVDEHMVDINMGCANTKLREWAAERKCVNCKFISPNKRRCGIIGKFDELSSTGRIWPSAFSCAAFENSPTESIK